MRKLRLIQVKQISQGQPAREPQSQQDLNLNWMPEPVLLRTAVCSLWTALLCATKEASLRIAKTPCGSLPQASHGRKKNAGKVSCGLLTIINPPQLCCCSLCQEGNRPAFLNPASLERELSVCHLPSRDAIRREKHQLVFEVRPRWGKWMWTPMYPCRASTKVNASPLNHNAANLYCGYQQSINMHFTKGSIEGKVENRL